MKLQYYLHAGLVLPSVFRSLLYQLRAYANLFDLIVPVTLGKVTNYECPHTEELQGDQKVSVHLMIIIQKVTSNVPSVPRQSADMAADRQGQGDTRLTLTPSVIHNSKYVIMVSDLNCLKYFCVFCVL
jgi:hypothetical protein